ncbi:MAG TPA: AmmeMemoRadiSam system radical SAM enzyme, partial [Polyangia bacterium]
MYPARWWQKEPDGKLLCTLCPRYCRLGDGQAGFCFIRKNEGGELVSLGYGRTTGFASDPIEKKPLNHFLPGTSILSFGTAGCNLGCKFCQNWDMSKAREMDRLMDQASPELIAETAVDLGCRSVAYTYNDPVIFAEYAIDTALACRERGVYSVAVTAGYVNPEARRDMFAVMDAANVDLKGFTDDFYAKITGARLRPVLDTLTYLVHETDVWVEITTLLIPGYNDSDEELHEMGRWVRSELGPDVPHHVTAFHPDWRMRDVPPTPAATLRRGREILLEEGLHHVYTGNVPNRAGEVTYCSSCQAKLIERDQYDIL